jgi:hypothetical protein
MEIDSSRDKSLMRGSPRGRPEREKRTSAVRQVVPGQTGICSLRNSLSRDWLHSITQLIEFEIQVLGYAVREPCLPRPYSTWPGSAPVCFP